MKRKDSTDFRSIHSPHRLVSDCGDLANCLAGYSFHISAVWSHRDIIDVDGKSKVLAAGGCQVTRESFSSNQQFAIEGIVSTECSGLCVHFTRGGRRQLNIEERAVAAENRKRIEEV